MYMDIAKTTEELDTTLLASTLLHYFPSPYPQLFQLVESTLPPATLRLKWSLILSTIEIKDIPLPSSLLSAISNSGAAPYGRVFLLAKRLNFAFQISILNLWNYHNLGNR